MSAPTIEAFTFTCYMAVVTPTIDSVDVDMLYPPQSPDMSVLYCNTHDTKARVIWAENYLRALPMRIPNASPNSATLQSKKLDQERKLSSFRLFTIMVLLAIIGAGFIIYLEGKKPHVPYDY